MSTRVLPLHLLLPIVCLCGSAEARKPVPVWDHSLSPDGVYGLRILPSWQEDLPRNELVEVKSGRVVYTIPDEPIAASMNHTELVHRWTRDSRTLFWHVEGKWGSDALRVIHLEGGRVAWATEVRERAVRRVLAQMKRRRPRAWRMNRHIGRDDGSWFRDGLAIDVRPAFADEEGALASLPAAIVVEVTANVKGDPEYPHAAWIHAFMDGVLAADGTLRFGNLRFEKEPWKNPDAVVDP